jgi:inorganic pyrophosphatase
LSKATRLEPHLGDPPNRPATCRYEADLAIAAVGLDRLALRHEASADLTIVVETPRGSRNKYKYDPATGALKLAAVLAAGLTFPVSFGFFPSTLGEDGDPLDVLLLLDTDLPPGCVVSARLVGVLQVEQQAKGQKWTRNDRYLAVASLARAQQEVRSLSHLRPIELAEIEAFLAHYAAFEGKRLKFIRRGGPTEAARRLRAGEKAFKEKR